ncbi:MAG: hypothetical protein RL146_373 [Actinomycetota bacterium]|jgi:hypothetical protein
MSDQNSPSEQEPEATRRDRIEKKLEKYRFLHNSSIGKKWAVYKEKLKSTKQGKLVLRGLNVLLSIGVLVLISWIRAFGGDLLRPADYNLTEQQVGEGYSRTWSDTRNGGQDDIYFRFYEDDEYSLPSCDSQFDWCVFAIPLHKDCSEITMNFETTKTEDSSEVVEEIRVSVESENGAPFFIGQRATLGVKATKAESMLGEVKSIYCTR